MHFFGFYKKGEKERTIGTTDVFNSITQLGETSTQSK